MIVDKVWKLTNTVRVGLDARSSHTQTQSTFPDTVCSYCPPYECRCDECRCYERLQTRVEESKRFGFPRFVFLRNGMFIEIPSKWFHY